MTNDGKGNQLSKEILHLVSYCPLCQAPARPKKIRVLQTKDDNQLIHIDCSLCHSSILALVINSGYGVTSVGLATDLTDEEAMHFQNSPKITTDDVIAIHDLLFNYL
ncbi:hypothetical protein KKC17_04100 [Patescibacteria group bacterium]|nr:hypothetical protein [Patescibacteria group bacterium]